MSAIAKRVGVLCVLMGIPACGKSTYAANMERNGWIVVSTDRVREQLTGSESAQSKNDEVFKIAHEMVRSLLSNGSNVVFDATNVQARSRNELLNIVAEIGALSELHVINTPWFVCLERNKIRERVVPEHAMDRMRDQFIESLPQIQSEAWGVVLGVRM
jgi:predicted kinase